MKTYYLTLSKVFPSTHAKAGMNTCFEEKLRVYKLHTIRANYDFWKKRFEQIAAGKACLSIRQWVGKPLAKVLHNERLSVVPVRMVSEYRN